MGNAVGVLPHRDILNEQGYSNVAIMSLYIRNLDLAMNELGLRNLNFGMIKLSL